MGYPIFTGLLVIGALSAESGLLVLNRVVLAGTMLNIGCSETLCLLTTLI